MDLKGNQGKPPLVGVPQQLLFCQLVFETDQASVWAYQCLHIQRDNWVPLYARFGMREVAFIDAPDNCYFYTKKSNQNTQVGVFGHGS